MKTKITIAESFPGLWRAYEDDLLIGSSTWLLADAKKVETYNGWDIYSRTAPADPRLKYKIFFQATNTEWSKGKNKFHLHDHNPATSIEEIKDAIDYWNNGGV